MGSYIRLDQSEAEDWHHICAEHAQYYATGAPLRVMDHIRKLEEITLGFPCHQLQHSLMTATLARAAGADDETLVMALCHDIGKSISVPNHAAIGAEILRPYVSDDHYRAVLHHQEFQALYYFHHFGMPNTQREAYREAGWFALAEALVDDWDMPAFDPDFSPDPLESFEPAVVRVFSAPRMM